MTRADIPDRIAATVATAVLPDRKGPWGLRDRWVPWDRGAARDPGESQDRPAQWVLRVMWDPQAQLPRQYMHNKENAVTMRLSAH
ncbi:hypothetical protein F220043C3_13270 [Enterocloster asparagiformis]